MKIASKQQGASLFTLLISVVLLVLITMFIIKLVPIYAEHFDVQHALNSLPGEPSLHPEELSNDLPDAIKITLRKYFQVNNVTKVDIDKNIKISPTQNGTLVRAVYDIKTPLFGNISLLVHFDDSIEVPNR